jgi:hypothetical protein
MKKKNKMKKLIGVSGRYILISVGIVLSAAVFYSCRDKSKYKQIEPYSSSDGLAPALSKEDKWGYVDENKNEVIPCVYFYADNFVDGFAIAAKGEKEYGIIDKSGKEIVPFKYEELKTEYYAFQEGVVIARLENKYGVIDRFGKEILPCKYDAIQFDYGKKQLYCTLNDETYWFDFQGNEMIYKSGRMKIGAIDVAKNAVSFLDEETQEKLIFRSIEIIKHSDKLTVPNTKWEIYKIMCEQRNGKNFVQFVPIEGVSAIELIETLELEEGNILRYTLLNNDKLTIDLY